MHNKYDSKLHVYEISTEKNSLRLLQQGCLFSGYYSILSKISIQVETFSQRENKGNHIINLLQYEVVFLFVK